MSISKSISSFAVFTFALFLATATQAAVSLGTVGKESLFNQVGPDPEDVVPDDGPMYSFGAQIMVEASSDLTNPTIHRVGGATMNLIYDSDEEGYEVYADFWSLALLDASHPNGQYVLSYTPSGSTSSLSKTMSLTNGFSPALVIENWFDLRHFPVGEDVTVGWSSAAGGAEDIIVIEVDDPDGGDQVFNSGVHYFGDSGALDGTGRSVTIPAGTFTANKSYDSRLLYLDIETVDLGVTVPGVLFASYFQTETEFRIRTVDRHPSPVINRGVLSRWTTFQQADANTVQPVVGEGSAYVEAGIWLDNPDDLTGASFAGHALVKSPGEGGWIFSHLLNNAAELQAWLPNGEYRLDYNFAAGGSHFTTLDLTGGALPRVMLSNWDVLQYVSADQVIPIQWAAPDGVRASDAFIVRIETQGGDVVFETDLDLDQQVGLDGTDTSVDVPAGTLDEDETYSASISYLRFTDIDSHSQTDATFVALNGVETRFNITTAAAVGDPVAIGAVGREVSYLQSGTGAPMVDLVDSDQFSSFAVFGGESVDQLVSGSVILPGGAERPMSFDAEEGIFNFSKPNTTFDALLADFPSGDYTLRYLVVGGAPIEVGVHLGDTFPAPPHIINWTEAQSVVASEPFSLKWLPIDEMTEADAIAVYVENSDGDEIFASDFYFIDSSGLSGTAVSVSIPAGTLQANQTYDVLIDALHFTDLDDSREGQLFGAFNMRSTSFSLVTTGANQTPAITTESLENAQEGEAYFANIVGSDPEDGASVEISGVVVPSWLSLTDSGGGVAVLSGTPGAENVGSFTVTVSVTDTQGSTSSREFSLIVNPDLSDPEGRALDLVGINWLRDQTSPFASQITEVQFGESALISGSVGDGAVSFLNGTFTGPIKLSFYWKVSSEAGKDFFRVSVDDTVEAEISGEQNWREQVITLPAGDHSVVWSYEKDGAGAAGADRGWVDHVSILPADVGDYAGTYLGEIASSTGEVSLYIRPNNTAVFLGYHPESGKGLSNFAFEISDLGTFSFEVVNPDDLNSNYTVSGSINSGVATGSVSGLNLTFSADLVSGGGQVVSYDGYYQNALAATTSGLVYLIVATDGQAYFYAQDGDYVEGFITTIDALGNITLRTGQGVDYDLHIDPSTDIVAGTYAPPGGEVSNILGIREGSPGDELLANISTRGKVLTGGKVMIASFVINGTGSKQLLIRAIGPKLASFGVAGVLQDPVIDLIKLGALDPIVTNDDWSDDGQVTRIVEDSIRLGAFPLDPGALDAVMVVSLEPGAYTAKIRGNGGLTGVSLVEVYDADDPTKRLPTADVVNIATRGEVGTGAEALIAGFVVSGDVPKRILLRGIGPQLTAFGVLDALADPRIDLTNSDNELVASNNDWGDNPDLAAVISSTGEVGAFALDEGSLDSALLIWLEPGAYTAKVSGADGGTGVALIEVYDN